jgi:hypothetical protein
MQRITPLDFFSCPENFKINKRRTLIEKQNKKYSYAECFFLSSIKFSFELERSVDDMLKKNILKIFKTFHSALKDTALISYK